MKKRKRPILRFIAKHGDVMGGTLIMTSIFMMVVEFTKMSHIITYLILDLIIAILGSLFLKIYEINNEDEFYD